MTDYYEPTFLFRQNAIKRFSPSLSPISSVESLSLVDSNSISNNGTTTTTTTTSSIYQNASNSSWLLNSYNVKDTAILNQSCCLNRTNVKSNYWKIPDESMNLTSMSINKNQGGNPILAISSGKSESNLFIYELNLFNNHLIHHHTISLPNIHAMKWINNTRYLVTGNNKGYAHLVSTPKLATHDVFNTNSNGDFDYDDDEDEYDNNSAEICKRFNHRKHLKQNQLENTISTPIKHLNFLNNHENLLSIYNDYLFYWDIKGCHQQTRPSPISISTVSGIKNFDVLENNHTSTNTSSANTVAICGLFGVSLFDLRDCQFNIPNYNTAQIHDKTQSSYRKLSANIVKWNPMNTNILAAGHGDGVIRLWDIRKQDSYIAELYGHNDYSITTSMEWNNNDLFTGSKDGNIIHWDLSNISKDSRWEENDNTKLPISCGLKEGFNSIEFNGKANKLETKLDQYQCGTILPASNSSIVAMCSTTTTTSSNDPDDEEIKILSIDSSSFLGVHNKVSESINVNINTNKLYYTEEDIQLLLQSQLNNNNITSSSATGSNDTLISFGNNVSQDSLVKPLTISRKPTTTIKNTTTTTATTRPTNTHTHSASIDESIVSVHNVSNDTLVNSPTRFNICESEDEFTFNYVKNNTNNEDQRQNDNRNSSFSSVSSQQTQLNDSVESLSTVVTDVENEVNHQEHKYSSLLLPVKDTSTTTTKDNNTNSDQAVTNTPIISI
ncbi:protein DSE1 [Candida albicans P34048]|nr:protein DSE1 [Candida albicans P34048]